ncbi:GNAT family N-acetyltransferase [Paucibacter sp. XJ19-41]|uniref:GNAT family N-acetyltransferase n=1 Tax=Paucibacter sp. XJ19-41 TaxID=2927824 RepID=UPI00234B670D|nr:GNAT family N-acetyltransferase [Paucibacter sp. XJ19-41]MDC6166111.1 GNAT family N-acetyltransferase [Paucibacter sp. XJ19-41]
MASPPLQWKLRPAQALRDDPAIRSAWDRLNSQRGDLPFMSADAVGAALAAFGSGQERLAVASRGAEPVALFVLVPDGRLRWATFQPSQLPLGTWVAAPDLQLADLARSLCRGPLGLCLALSITQVDPLCSPRPADGADARGDDYIETAWIDVAGSFEDYWAARGKNLRQNMRKQRNKLAADGVQTSMRMITDAASVASALDRYGALESAGWKAQEGTAIHPDNAQGRFYRELFERAAVRGEMVFYEYLFDEQTVAMNLCLLRRGQLIVLKTAYDESIKALSPAFLLREEELQRFFGEGQILRVEYFGKVMDWHTKLTQDKRCIYHYTQYRWPWLTRLAERRRAATRPSAPATADTAAVETN